MSSALLTREVVERAVRLLRPMVEEEFIKNEKGRCVAAICVFDPTVEYFRPDLAPIANGNPSLPILWEGLIGETDTSKWPVGRDYRVFARLKATIAWKTRKATHLIQRNQPHLYSTGDFKYGGGTFFEDIPIGTSGLKWQKDLATSNSLGSLLHAFCLESFENQLSDNENYFVVGQETEMIA